MSDVLVSTTLESGVRKEYEEIYTQSRTTRQTYTRVKLKPKTTGNKHQRRGSVHVF